MSGKRPLEADDSCQNERSRTGLAIKRAAGAGPDPEDVNPNPPPNLDPVPSALKVFNNELIMQKLAEELPAQDLLTLRQSCTTWSRSLTPTLKKIHTSVSLCGAEPLGVYVDLMRVRVRSRQDLPFAKYRIEADGDPIEWRANFEDFLAVVGHSVTLLGLRWWLGPFFSVHDLRRLIFEQTPRLATLDLRPDRPYGYREDPSTQVMQPSMMGQPPRQILKALKRLKVMCPLGDLETSPALGQLVADVIKSTTGGLEYISMKLGAGETAQNLIGPTLDALSATATHVQFQIHRLKTLKLSRVTTVELRTLCQLGQRRVSLRLDTLFMAVVPSRTSTLNERREPTSLFHEFLLTQAQTLRKLCLEFFSVEIDPNREQNTTTESWKKFGPTFHVPRMEQLRSLKLTRSEKMRIGLDFEPAPFPVLHTLTYRHYPKQGLDTPAGIGVGAGGGGPPLEQNLVGDLLLFSNSGVANTITDLRVSASCDNFTRFNSSVFPSVTRFQLTITYASGYTTQDTLAGIWRLLSASAPLRTLHITIMFNKIQLEPINMDQFVSGVNSLIVARQLAELKAPPSLDNLRTLPNQYRPEFRPSILDLEHMEELAVVTQAWVTSREGLTDVGAYLGLALAAGATGSRLKKVEIYGAPGVHMENHISDQCREYLRGVMGPDAVINI